jgi:hypothetical protein
MKDDALTTPHNQLGEPATTTTLETVTRLQEKASNNNGGANRERIRARIAGRFKNSRSTSLQLPQRRGWGIREASRAARSGRALLWLVPLAVVIIGVISASRSRPLMKVSRRLYQSMRR